jgi:hypothetical protein
LRLTLGQIADWIHAEGDFTTNTEAVGYSIDSRTIAARELVFDANHNRFTIDQYPNKTAVAHINHYVCRSFTIWMARVQRGCLSYEPPPIRPIARGGMRNKNACANS